MSDTLRVLSLGAGVQSSTLALMMTAGEVPPPDFAVFADTQSEPQSVYRWLDWLKGQLSFPVHVVTAGSLEERVVSLKTSRLRVAKETGEDTLFGPEPEHIIGGQVYIKGGIPGWTPTGPLPRLCTSDHKVRPIRRFVLERMRELEAKRLVQVMGISYDEVQRMRAPDADFVAHDYPLVDMRYTRAMCLEWMEARGYPKPPRSACYFCPYHSDREWARLKREEPEEFARAVAFEGRYQAAAAQTVIRAKPYLHISCVPLAEVDFSRAEAPDPQRGLFSGERFGNECEGMCGV